MSRGVVSGLLFDDWNFLNYTCTFLVLSVVLLFAFFFFFLFIPLPTRKTARKESLRFFLSCSSYFPHLWSTLFLRSNLLLCSLFPFFLLLHNLEHQRAFPRRGCRVAWLEDNLLFFSWIVFLLLLLCYSSFFPSCLSFFFFLSFLLLLLLFGSIDLIPAIRDNFTVRCRKDTWQTYFLLISGREQVF
jgi:hypothetical protein